jgi:hypothetical protein
MKMGQSVPKRRHIKFRRQEITQKKTYNRVALVGRVAQFSQSASTLQSGETGLTLNFGNAWLKRDKKTLSMRLFRKYQGSGQNVCLLWWNIK